MNDSLQILGTLVLVIVLSVMLTGKSLREFASMVRANTVSTEEKTLLAFNDYVPPTWRAVNHAVKDSSPVIDGDNHNNSETRFASYTAPQYEERSDFKNSATNDGSRGDIVVAAKNPSRSFATASVTQANTSLLDGSTVSDEALLLIVIMLMVLMFLVRLTFRKKKRINAQYGYRESTTPPNRREYRYNYQPYLYR